MNQILMLDDDKAENPGRSSAVLACASDVIDQSEIRKYLNR